MTRLVVLADQETTLGFQLTGVEVFGADDAAGARAQLLDLLGRPEIGLIAVSAALLEQFDDATRRRVESCSMPVVIAIPTGGPAAGLPSRRERLAALIRRAIGFQITFPAEGEDG